MSITFAKDLRPLENLMNEEVIVWGEVTRLARDQDGQGYMIAELPVMAQHKIAGGERCVIFADEADADNVNPRLMNLIGRKIPFVILAVDEENDWLICSRKKAQLHLKGTMIQGIADGNIYEGELVGFSRFGAYIEVNGVTGHIRNSDFTDDHSDVREYLVVGDTVQVKCKEVSSEGYIFWEATSKMHRTKPVVHDFEPDMVVTGRVIRISNFANGVGVFVNLKVGIDALCGMPRETEVEEGSRVAVKIDTVTPGSKPTDPPRIRGHILRVC